MRVRIGFDISFETTAAVPMVFALSVHPSRARDLHGSDRVWTEPAVPVEEFSDSFGNRCGRLVAPGGRLRLWSDNTIEDTGLPEPDVQGLSQLPVEDLPLETIPFLLPSRYCEVDLLSDTAWDLFGALPPGWQRVRALLDWVHGNVEFGYQHASPLRSAVGVWEERKGVCRDFQHLAITFCRALNIPARYATGYLGDIGVPPSASPMDFSAWFEVYLGDRWVTVDARHNRPRIARVLMARGRDAADVALTTSFGTATLRDFRVWTDEVPPDAVELAETSDSDEDEVTGRAPIGGIV